MRIYMNLGYTIANREAEREITIEDATEAQASLALEGFFKAAGVDLVGEVVVNMEPEIRVEGSICREELKAAVKYKEGGVW